MRDIDHRRPEVLVKPGDFKPHLDAKLGVKIGQRLVEQEDFRLADNRAPDGHPLALAARKRLRLSAQEIMKPQNIGRLAHAAVDLFLACPVHLQAEGHVVIDRHMRIQRIGLEHHGDAAVGGIGGGHVVTADGDPAACHAFQPGDHPQKGGFAASRRADKHGELAGINLEIDTVDDLGLAE